jgi:dipeptidyl aminopeptidase/acylaminoacyl peptidase
MSIFFRLTALLSLVFACNFDLYSAPSTPMSTLRVEQGNLALENVKALPPSYALALKPYAQIRSAVFSGFLPQGGITILTRFAETAQIHHVSEPGADRQQLTFFDEPIFSVAPNPSAEHPLLVFAKDVGGNEMYQLHVLNLSSKKNQAITHNATRNMSPVWSVNGALLAYSSTRRNGVDTDVWSWSVQGQERILTERSGNWEPVTFSPDGTKLLVVQKTSINQAALFLLDLKTRDLKKIADAGGVSGSTTSYPAIFIENGNAILYASNVGGEYAVIKRIELKTLQTSNWDKTILADTEELAVSSDQTKIAAVYNLQGSSWLRVFDASSKKILHEQKTESGVLSGALFSPDSTQIGYTINSSTLPGDAFSLDLQSGKQTRWTVSESGGLNAENWKTATLIKYPTFDQIHGQTRMIPAFTYLPVGDGPFPVIIDIHGGPEAQRRPTFDAWSQYLVKELGVAVIQPNVRGSSGYGRSWLDSDNGFKRMDSVRDIEKLIDWIESQPNLDAKRIGVYGGSYGGFMTLASMVEYSDRLRAGVCIVGISHFKTFLENTSPYRVDLRRVEYGDERVPKMSAFMEKIAPLNNAKKITKPLFVIHGANDPRVPASEAEQILKAVRQNNQPAWFLLAKDEGHGFRKKTNREASQRALASFWKQFLLPTD